MQLVGATPLFIKKPFLLRGSLHGALSGIIAVGFIIFSIHAFLVQFPEFLEIQNRKIVLLVCIFIILLGAIIGFFSSLLAVNRYIHMKLNKLY